jgi:hypothetical protein
MKQKIIILIGLLFLTSCGDCYQIVTGTVLDTETKRPVEGITVYNKNKPINKTVTDQEGKFELYNISGGLWKCPPMKVAIEHSDYQTKEVEIPAGGELTIEIERRNKQSNSKNTIELMQGLWYHSQDSLASITINKYKWTFKYKGVQTDSDGNYTILLTDKLPEFVKETENAEFFILVNKSDTLKYEILGLTDSTFSMMYFPAGKIHLYIRKK